jgi:hypothetical protein
MGWVFFIFSVVERLTGRGWAAAIYPAGTPLPTPAHPDGLHVTGSKADHARQGTHAQTLDTLGDRDGGGAGMRAVCPKLCKSGQAKT